jgi:hypothetical protein
MQQARLIALGLDLVEAGRHAARQDDEAREERQELGGLTALHEHRVASTTTNI